LRVGALGLAAWGFGGTPPSAAPPRAGAASEAASEAAAPSASGEAAFPEPEISDITLGLSGSVSITSLPTIIAAEEGLFEKYGVNVEVTEFDGANPANQALLAGQIQAVAQSVGPVVASQNTEEPLVFTFIVRSNLTDIFVGGPDIEGPEDLQGQSVAVSGFGAQSHAAVLLALDELGMEPTDVTITQVGGDSDRMAALEAGSVAAAPLDGSRIDVLEEQGYNVLVDLAGVSGGVPYGLAFTRAFVDENPNTVLALTAGLLEGLTMVFTDPQLAIEKHAERNELSMEDAAAEMQLEFDRNWEPRDGRAQQEWFEDAQELLVLVDPTFEDVDETLAYTNDFVDQLEELGLYEELGAPVDIPESVDGS
jgi:NitT/TauT family transport system substrate-binding protein